MSPGASHTRLGRATGSLPSHAGGGSAVARQRQAQLFSMTLDVAIVLISGMVAYLARFEGSIPHNFFRQMVVLIPALAALRVLSSWLFGVYRMVWRYVGLSEALRFAQAGAAVSLLLVLGRVFLYRTDPHLVFPFSIIIMEGALSFIGMAGIRFVPRIRRERARDDVGAATLLIGAGEGGLAVVKEAMRHPELDVRPVGFLDDDPHKAGMSIAGLRVLGTVRDVTRVIRQTGAERVIITSAAFPAKAVGAIMDAATPLGVDVRIVRGTYETMGAGAGGSETPALVREVRIEDLLSRDPVPPSLSRDDLSAHYGGKRVMVTGAGGSIGAELCRQLAVMGPAKLYLCERDETNLFEIERELGGSKGPGGMVQPVLLDIMDARALERAFKDLQPQVVFHAAAYKHVPMMERFPWEAVRNNVFATKQLAELADEHGVESFVMISTDKAINPTSVMGATKRFAEQVVQSLAARSKTRFSCVRFGNVLGSRGSVVGIFKDQIADGGPVTVTHPEATRYFMTIPEASNLVLQAGTLGANGEVFLLDMGEPVKIIDLARQLIRLSGFTEVEIPIKIVGTRPGEKLFEELSTTSENLAPTDLRKIFRCAPVPLDDTRLTTLLERLAFIVKSRDADGVRQALRDLDIGYEVTPARQA
ncbi:MAG TPA: nucleoside-diphosphate sugar epimerase/dehydratase [Kofleriaceae bacterium]|nr:nucleoside-diphosphate sugar epimerase/dehydratase [Kofleriaceae bacterium]